MLMARLAHPLVKAVRKAMSTPGEFHSKVMLVASHLKDYPEDAVIECLHHAAKRVTRRRMSRTEVANLVTWVRQGKGHSRREEKGPKECPVSPSLQAEVDSIGWSIDKMRERSEPVPGDPSAILPLIYKGDPWLCVGRLCHDFAVRRLSEWRQMDLTRHERLCPNPFNAPFLTKQDGSTSFKCNELVSHRKFIVIEFDEAELDQQATRIGWLAKRFPLCLCLFSGSKSLHGYFRADHATLPRLRLFFELAMKLGADKMMWTKSQFSRLPGGLNHKTGKQQEVLFIHADNAG